MILLRLLLALAVALLLPPLLLLNAASLALVDLAWLLTGRRRSGTGTSTAASELYERPTSLSVVIPSWDGRELLEKFLPSVVRAASFHPDNEVIVVDNGSDDGTAEWVRQEFPEADSEDGGPQLVRLLQMGRNLGFGSGNNAGVRAARNNIVAVLNNDMRVEPDCFERLLEGFTDPAVFAVSAQIFFLDEGKRREETGLTEGRFEQGFFRLGHLAEEISTVYPTFYAGGGSTVFDRAKFFELGGFDSLFHPFYVEDADLSYNAWKRGWKVLYQPPAVVYHEHRGTIGRHFSAARVGAILKKNHILMVWKNMHRWSWLAQHFCCLYAGLVFSALAQPSPTRPTLAGYLGALRRWGKVLRRRWQARRLSRIGDREALLRPLPAYYRDRFAPPPPLEEGRPLRILFLSPYSLHPPTHGGAVFMQQAARALARRHQVHLLTFVDRPEEVETNRGLERHLSSVECVLRDFPPRRDGLGILPYPVRSFLSPEFQRRVHRLIWNHQIDLVQVEYMQMGQFASGWRHTPTALFEHDVYFQSARRALRQARSVLEWLQTCLDWLRALHYEVRLLRRMDLVETCSETERRLLESLLGRGAPPIRGTLRAAVDTSDYAPVFTGRQPEALLFVGNFCHAPNLGGLRFLVQRVMPALRAKRPSAELLVAGAYPGAEVEALCQKPGVHLLGMVPEIRELLARYALLLCPIFSGSGVRVKILEAFAAGIPVISTPLGVEGLEVVHGRELLLASNARQFVSAIMEVLEDPQRGEALARRARRSIEQRWDTNVVLERLQHAYWEILRERRVVIPEGASLITTSSRSS